MSNRHWEAARGRAVIIARAPNTFAEEYVAKGFYLPDQYLMQRMKLAASLGLSWEASWPAIWLCSILPRTREFHVFSLNAYEGLEKNTWGAPIPPVIRARIDKVLRAFPDAEVWIHALQKDDPFVEFRRKGESIFTDAWWRPHRAEPKIFPSVL